LAISSTRSSPATTKPAPAKDTSAATKPDTSATSTSTSTSATSAASTAASRPVERAAVSAETLAATRDRVAARGREAEEAFHSTPTTSPGGPSRGLSDAPAAAAPAAFTNFQRGARGDNVRDAQGLLNRAGASLDSDGKFGSKTEAAVRDFQARNGLAVDGIVGPNTMRALKADAAKPVAEATTTQPKEILRWGAKGAEVKSLQEGLNRAGYKLQSDGHMGNETYAAVRDFQSRAGLAIDGAAGPNTQAALADVAAGKRTLAQPDATGRTQAATGSRQSRTDVPNNVAQFDRTTRTGQRNQMAHGRITVNGNTYDFRSGGGGRGNLPPGDYNITRHRDRRSDKPTMMVDGEGYSFAMSNKYDARVGGTRTLLRIHPDGRGAGTIGCMGIVGNGAVQRQFRADMLAELKANGGSYTLSVRP